MTEQPPAHATIVVIGGGQAGLSAAYHLQRHGFVSALDRRAIPVAPGTGPATADTQGPQSAAGAAAETEQRAAQRTFVVVDANPGPGGAWQHRWDSLRVATLNHIFDLPGYPKPPLEPTERSSVAVPRYFAGFEREFGLPILRPVAVSAVRRADDDPAGGLVIETDHGTWTARAIINATGTWDNPTLPSYPGEDTFLGRQLHTRDYVALEEFAGHRVAVVGGGISAIQQLEEISRVATVRWYTRREPVFIEGSFQPETTGRAVIDKVTADVEAGRPTGSVVSYTGLAWTPYAIAARDRGALVRRPMFTRIEPYGVREADGSFTSLDTILWATGFKASLRHLDPLHLRNELGGITMRGTRVADEPRVHLVGFGPSQSTVGANRAGRDAAAELARWLERSPALGPA